MGSRTSQSWRVVAIVVALVGPLPALAQWAADPDTTVRNEFGPDLGYGAAFCRGSCGGDCDPDNCFEEFVRWECVSETQFRVVRTYNCGTHEGCREHDDCLDECSVRQPGSTYEGEFYTSGCALSCHLGCLPGYGASCGIWAGGYQDPARPFDGRTRFEYTKNSPSAEEPLFRCPDGTRLACYESGAVCYPEPEIEEPAEPVEGQAVGVVIDAPAICNDPAQPVDLQAAVIGLQSSRVTWSVISGPGRFNPASGRLTANGEGTVVVEAASVSDPMFTDQATVHFEDCTCYFHATLSGDVSRAVVEGDFALWSIPGEDAANVAGPLLRSLESLDVEDATGLDADALDGAIEAMRREAALFILKMVEGGDDVNSFNLTTYPKQEMGGEAGIMALIDGLQFIGPGELDIHSSDKGWIEGVLRAETGPEGGVALRDGRGPPPRGYQLQMYVEFRAGNPYRGAFCKPPGEGSEGTD